MGIYTRDDSPWYWMWLEGYSDERGRPLREKTKFRRDAATTPQRKENRRLADQQFHTRMTHLGKGATDPEAKPAIGFCAFATWYRTHKLPRRRGREREAEILDRLIATFGDTPLATLTPSLVTERWITPRLTTPHAIRRGHRTVARTVTAGPGTVNREVDVLKAILQAAVPEYLERSPLYGMKRERTTTPKRRLLTAVEETRLLVVMAPDDKALFLIARDSLVRLGDVLDIKRDDVRGDRVWIADPKAGGGFEVPLSRRAQAALQVMAATPDRGRYLRKLTTNAIAAIKAACAASSRTYSALAREHGVSEAMVRRVAAAQTPESPDGTYLFARYRFARTDRDRRSAIQRMLKRACAAATPPIPYGRRVGGIVFHWATRRTGATQMLINKVDLGTVQKIGRWKTPDVVLGIYHELIDEKATEAVELAGGHSRLAPASPDRVGKQARKR